MKHESFTNIGSRNKNLQYRKILFAWKLENNLPLFIAEWKKMPGSSKCILSKSGALFAPSISCSSYAAEICDLRRFVPRLSPLFLRFL